ncbi:Ig-like domain-containing protein [candidate division KSB1 bacterium]|nr:Ig-like domain-containing protein [candidate division KSB1 bacterium]
MSTITATFALTITAQTLVNFTGGGQELLNISVKANPTEIIADGTSSSEITVTVKNTLNNPIQNVEVLFKTSLGLIDATALTNGIGVATANLISERSDGIALITAELRGITQTTQVSFVGTQIEITAQPEALEADGSAQTVIRVSLRDGAGIPIESALITLQTVDAVFSNDSTIIKGFSDVNGILIDSLKSVIQGVASVTAAAAGKQTSTSIKFTRLVTTLVADTNSIAANDSVRLTFTIADLDGSPQTGEQVLFFTNLGDVNPPESVTDANGQAFTYLSSTIGGVATVSAKVTNNLVTPTPPTTIVTIVSAPPANIKLIVDPVVVAVNGGTVELTAIVTDISGNPVANRIVSFKIVQGPAGGESIDPTFAVTDATGSAKSIFKSGSIGSKTVNSVILRATLQEVSISDEAFLTIAGEPSRINTSSSPPPVDNQDGTFSLAIGSIVSDINGNPVTDGTLVHYSTNPPIGVILSPIETENGKASTSLIYPTNSAGDNITIIASSREISDTLIINQLPTAGVAGFVDSLKIKGANDNSILADGESVTLFRVLIVDPTQNPVAGVIVDFTVNPGNNGTGLTQDQLLADGTQNPNWGIASFALKSVSSKEDLYPAVTVSAGGRTVIFQENGIPDQLDPFLYRGITLTTNSERDTIKVGETVTIKALLKETTNSVALSSRKVTFGSSLGFIVNEETTNDRGEIEILFEAGEDSGLVKINATFGTNIKDSTFVFIQQEAVKPAANIFVTADTSFIKIKGGDGPNSTGLTVRITNTDNNPVVEGLPVNLATTLGTFVSTGINAVLLFTNEEGIVKEQLQSGTQTGTAVITAVSGSATTTLSLVTFQAGIPDIITVSADTVGTLLTGNLIQIGVSALITDLNGNPVASGTLVSFSTEDDGSGNNPGVSIMSTASTNDFGIITTTMTYTVADIGKGLRIRAAAGGVSGFRDIKLPPAQ